MDSLENQNHAMPACWPYQILAAESGAGARCLAAEDR